ncbi:hypothetical protein LCGC14_0246040 [marine sediment metagenome]|uniref:Uncharacterized protein n=1 Tax=marine sediment metagenome TaxID=412755 RepID=A0A0F9XAM4_9ZZZZ
MQGVHRLDVELRKNDPEHPIAVLTEKEFISLFKAAEASGKLELNQDEGKLETL